MTTIEIILIGLPIALFSYAYLGYPLLLKIFGLSRPAPPNVSDPEEWPMISITVPAYNEEAAIRRTIESLLVLPYPAERRQILIISDASTDRTDDIVREYADRGIELLRMPVRGGKTAAENAAGAHLRGSIVVNTDATIKILPGALKALIRVFQDPTIGVASGRDLSVGDVGAEGNQGESGYVGYEMWLRSLETRMGSIVGASGCLYAIRRSLHETLFPEALSRDFACALIAKENGFRAVSVEDAVCLVPRTVSLKKEYSRKVRTMARGLDTLWYKRHLMNPFRHGFFAWALISHKLCRWLVFPAIPLGLIGLTLLAQHSNIARGLLMMSLAGLAIGGLGMRWPEGKPVPRVVALFGFALGATVAALIAWSKALRGERNPIWEPTRRPT
jgi:cellulose synthase/poly-beta-1,6-N-acetylglucosamine synthase-like glycosyltransferase